PTLLPYTTLFRSSILRRSIVTIRNIFLPWPANKRGKAPYFRRLAGAARRPAAASGHQAVERLAVLGRGFFQYVPRQARGRRGLVPVLGFQPVAHELLVERRRADADAIAVGRPEARGIRRQHFVHQVEPAIVVQAEFELGVGDDDALGGGELRGLGIQAQRHVADAFGHFLADLVDDMGEVDVFVVHAEFGLGRRREERFGQLAGLLQAGRQLDAAQRAGGLVVLPAGTDQVAARHGLDEDRLEALDHHRPAAHLVELVGRHHVFGPHAGGMVGQDVRQLAQPEFGQLGEHLPLAGNGVVEDHVEGGNAVGGDDEQFVVAHGVHVAHLAATQERQGLDAGLVQGGSHESAYGKNEHRLLQMPPPRRSVSLGPVPSKRNRPCRATEESSHDRKPVLFAADRRLPVWRRALRDHRRTADHRHLPLPRLPVRQRRPPGPCLAAGAAGPGRATRPGARTPLPGRLRQYGGAQLLSGLRHAAVRAYGRPGLRHRESGVAGRPRGVPLAHDAMGRFGPPMASRGYIGALPRRQGGGLRRPPGVRGPGGPRATAYCTTWASLPAAYCWAMSVSGRGLILLALPAVPNWV